MAVDRATAVKVYFHGNEIVLLRLAKPVFKCQAKTEKKTTK